MAALEIALLRRDVEPFDNELSEENYQNMAGLKDEMNSARIYDKYAHLFSREAVATINQAMMEAKDSEDSRWLRYLLRFSTEGCLGNAVKSLTDKSQTFQAQSVVDLDGEKIPLRSVPVKIRNEPDAAVRKRLFDAEIQEVTKLNEILLERMSLMHDTSVELGFRSYGDMMSSLTGIDYRTLEEQMEQVLRRTESLFVNETDELLKAKVGIGLTDAWKYDIPYTFRGDEFDKYFRKERLVDSFYTTLKNMGIDPTRYENVHLDIEERPKKSARAFCSAINVPNDIRLVILPSGGWDDYSAFFHEAGHTWHFASTKKELPAEYRYLGDNSVTESFASLFEYLTTNKDWLAKVFEMEEAEKYARFALVIKLWFIRRYAAKLIYELKLHNSKVSLEFQEVYRSCLQRALKVRHSEKQYLEDVDDGLYCVNYLRAWILEAQLRAALVDQFGEDWSMNEKTGNYLRELWSYGQKYSAHELVKTIGYVDLDIDPLLMEIERGLQE